MINFFVKRLLLYPLVSCIVWKYLFENFDQLLTLEKSFANSFPLPVSSELAGVLFGYLFGYVYGTISAVIKARTFRGLLFIIILLFKVIQSIVLASSFGIFILMLEILLIPIIFLMRGKLKERKRLIINKKRELERNKIKEEVLSELRKEMQIQE